MNFREMAKRLKRVEKSPHFSVECRSQACFLSNLQYDSRPFISRIETIMFGIDFIELLGYTATFFVAASFLFKSIVSLRTVNCIGAILFVIYGLVKQTYPVALLNIFLVAVNLYQLWRLKQEKQ